MSTLPLIYRGRRGRRGVHVIAGCRDFAACWHAECGICHSTSARLQRRLTSTEATAWLAQHVRDEHGTTP